MVLVVAAIAGTAVLARAQEATMSPAARPTPRDPLMMLPPTIHLTALPSYGNAPLTVGFFVDANDPADVGFVSYQWNFGDGHVSTLPPLMTYETYATPGTYIVTITATTADGRSASALTGVTAASQGLN